MIVVCGIVRKNSGLIICRRKKKPYESYWEFPGGKLEKGETKRQCLNRELGEELDIRVSIDRFFTVVSHNYDGVNIHLFCYLCSYLRGTIRLTEHQSFAVIRYSELLRFKLLEGNVKIAKKLKYLKFIN
ncbi:MAG: 8-oxo-dGTP diphosphatase MutT [Proteobacteria bacterium]|nr:8-oxo-dGTP diphosphatase MutT [Pseudomonadota bacterium]